MGKSKYTVAKANVSNDSDNDEDAPFDPGNLFGNLFKKEDARLHLIWSPAAKGFVRHKCGKPNCAEKLEAPADRRD